jgi:transcriptional regulator with XRE-family HTH domain
VRLARTGSRRTQDEVADALGVDRSSVVRMESGQRKVSALELAALAELFDVPLTYLLSPLHHDEPAVVSRRTAVADDPDQASRAVWRLGVDLAEHADDVRWLVARGLLPEPELRLAEPGSLTDPEAGAERVRAALDLPRGPLPALAGVAERWGLYLLVADRDADGCSMLLDEPAGVGVAVIGGQLDPGRRRATAAHELGHHLLGDAYSTDVGVSVQRDPRERAIDAFARALLLPAGDLRAAWAECDTGGEDWQWRALVRIAGSYRVSWTAAVQRARELGLVEDLGVRELAARRPVRGDLLAQLGAVPEEDLPIGATGPGWKRAVLHAYQSDLITAARAVQLLHGEVRDPAELPVRQVTALP